MPHKNVVSLVDPASAAIAVTPNDAADLPEQGCRGLYVGGAGDLQVNDISGNATVILKAVPAGTFVPLMVKRVLAGSTTATSIVALY